MRRVLQPLNDESGMVLVVTMLFMSALILLGATAVMVSTTDLRISGNYKTHAMALYAAEAGIEEARARLANGFTPDVSKISDAAPYLANWLAFATSSVMPSLQAAIPYTVTVMHLTNDGTTSGSVLYYGDINMDGKYEISTTEPADGHGPIYQVTSIGTSSNNANKQLVATVSKLPPITTPAALYVEAPTTIQGNSTFIKGTDSCGSDNRPGIATTLGTGTIGTTGNPTVCGTGATACNSGDRSLSGSSPNMDVRDMIDQWKGSADFSYDLSGSTTRTGMNWGTPVVTSQNAPSTCSVANIVYYNMHGSDLKLAGGSSGCGILMIEGDLELNGGFNWHGLILVTGSVTIAGGGNKNISGSVVAGGSAEADLVGGNVSILYCSSAINNLTANRALRYLSWTESTP